MTKFFLGTALLALALTGCKSMDGGGSDVLAGGGKGGNAGATAGLAQVAPGSSDNALNIPAVVQAMRDTKRAFYEKGDGYSAGNMPQYGEVAQCLGACPAYYSDLVCHFYCGYPSYQAVVPNIRGCFSYLANGSVSRADLNPARRMYYPEMYDYCLYQPYDKVKASEPPYDQKTIDANKAAGKKVGVLKWLDENQRDVFQYVVFTYYNPFAFKFEDQQDALNEFYGVKLAKKDYGPSDAAAVKECNAKRPRMNRDPWDGTHCSYKKPTNTMQKHPDWNNIVAFYKTLGKGAAASPAITPSNGPEAAHARATFQALNPKLGNCRWGLLAAGTAGRNGKYDFKAAYARLDTGILNEQDDLVSSAASPVAKEVTAWLKDFGGDLQATGCLDANAAPIKDANVAKAIAHLDAVFDKVNEKLEDCTFLVRQVTAAKAGGEYDFHFAILNHAQGKSYPFNDYYSTVKNSVDKDAKENVAMLKKDFATAGCTAK